MLDPDLPENHPDNNLEWMLLSDQVPQHQLIRELVKAFYQPLYKRAQENLRERALAQLAAERTLTAAVLHAHSYRGDDELEKWIEDLFEKEIHSTYRRKKLDVIFKRGKGEILPGEVVDAEAPLDAGKIARLTKRIEVSIEKIHRRSRTQAGLQWALALSLALLLILSLGLQENWSLPAASLSPAVRNTYLVTEIIRITATPSITPVPSITPIPTPFPQEAVLYTVKEGDTLQSIAEKTGIDVEILMALNAMEGDQRIEPGKQVMITTGQLPQAMVTPTAVTPAPSKDALTAQSSPEEIVQRIRESQRLWHTLWIDSQIIDYGPPSYIGPPSVKREQVWLTSLHEGLLISGWEGDSQLERIVLNHNGKTYNRSGNQDEYSVSSSDNPFLNYTQLSQLIYPAYREMMQERLKVVGVETVAGREAVVIDHYLITFSGVHLQGRYSIDAQTGVGLRQLTYVDEMLRMVGQEMRVVDIQYDRDFPPELFDPNAEAITYFTSGADAVQLDPLVGTEEGSDLHSSGRDPLPKLTPPPNFDPSEEKLTFQFPMLRRLGGRRDLADVFAGSYYIGTIEFADPRNISCARSSDGRTIAFFPYLDQEPYRGQLRWFDLLELTVMHDPLPDLLPAWGNLTFSPDSNRLALVSCQGTQPEGDCAIYVLDLASGKVDNIVRIHSGSGLTWSPDGQQLAFLGAFAANQEYQVQIIDLRTGEITYSGPFNWEDYSVADPEAPIYSWGVTFPNWDSSLEACSAPSR